MHTGENLRLAPRRPALVAAWVRESGRWMRGVEAFTWKYYLLFVRKNLTARLAYHVYIAFAFIL